VVFSDETLGNFEEADPESYARIRENFAYWGDIDTFYRGQKVPLDRPRLLRLSRRACCRSCTSAAASSACELHFQTR
jgi:anthraniloyl-CoA monooxygenase